MLVDQKWYEFFRDRIIRAILDLSHQNLSIPQPDNFDEDNVKLLRDMLRAYSVEDDKSGKSIPLAFMIDLFKGTGFTRPPLGKLVLFTETEVVTWTESINSPRSLRRRLFLDLPGNDLPEEYFDALFGCLPSVLHRSIIEMPMLPTHSGSAQRAHQPHPHDQHLFNSVFDSRRIFW